MAWLEFFYFYIFFYNLSKIYGEFFFAKMSPSRRFIRRNVGTAGWTGGRFIPSFQSAVGGRVGGPGTYRRLKRRFLSLTAGSSGNRLLLPNQPAEGPLLKRPRSGQRLRSHFQRRQAPPLARVAHSPARRRSPARRCAAVLARAKRASARPDTGARLRSPAHP